MVISFIILDKIKMMKEKIKETKYAKEHLKVVMSLDFTKPTPKMVEKVLLERERCVLRRS